MVVLVSFAGAAAAERQSLFPLEPARGGGAPVEPRSAAAAPSLFVDRAATGMFAPWPERAAAVPGLSGGSSAAQLLSLIARAEAGPAGYDAVQYGATIRPPGRPTELTLAQIDAWIDATPGQPHAIGRYQFIPPTLRSLVARKGLSPETRFTPEVQDRLAMGLLQDAGLRRFEAGELDRETFMRNLARIWAGLPLPDGRSYYDGYAGNRATMTWETFEAGIARIFPAAG